MRASVSGQDDEPRRDPRRLSNQYLVQAVEALESSGDPRALHEDLWKQTLPDEPGERGIHTGWARQRHQNYCRTAVLFAALAAESYVNEFLRAKLVDDDDFKSLDSLQTPDKYATGVFLLSGQRLFERGREPHNTIVDLMKLRSRLVHPKPGFGPVNPYFEPPGEFEARFTPPRVVHYIVQVARAASVLIAEAYPLDHIDITSSIVWDGRRPLQDYGRRLKDLPGRDARPAQKRLIDRCRDARERVLHERIAAARAARGNM